jgi:uncharacterized protein YidB (DUF937 family)
MRLIHQVIEDLRKLPDHEVTPIGAALEELLGGERGSLPELAERFTEAGLSNIMASWIGHGPIGRRDLRRVLGKERVGDLAALTGMTSGDFLVHLARLLPAAVHRMTREGELQASIASVRQSRNSGGPDVA